MVGGYPLLIIIDELYKTIKWSLDVNQKPRTRPGTGCGELRPDALGMPILPVM